MIWSSKSSIAFTDWMARCCDMLEQHSSYPQDRAIAGLVRQQRLAEEIVELGKSNDRNPQSEYQMGLIFSGMEVQLREWRNRMPADLLQTRQAPPPPFCPC